MTSVESNCKRPMWFLAIALTALVAGCGGGGGDEAPTVSPHTTAPPVDTAPTVDTTAPTVASTNPADFATGVCVNQTVNATFSEAMNASTLTTATFSVVNVLTTTAVDGSVTHSAARNIATFTPTADLAADTEYTATISGGASGAKDVASNALSTDKVWTFTTGTCTAAAVALGAAATFGAGSGTGITNQGTATVVNGDLGSFASSTDITGFHDLSIAYTAPIAPTAPSGATGCTYTETTLNIGEVTGRIYSSTPNPTAECAHEGTAETGAFFTAAAADLAGAADQLDAMTGATDPGEALGGRTLIPGVYAGGAFQITGADLTLDAQDDANAFWVFQAATTLTVGDTAPRSVILINGAQAKNVFWRVSSAATINAVGGGTMVGTIIADAAITFSTAGNVDITTLDGRAFSSAGITMANTVITVPAP
ncbi:MAG TPA: ice-binding family protein [Gemmatimonadaceae bacterium]|nr:ice-binding family protein [Gemmatimonadaceae bacterium]